MLAVYIRLAAVVAAVQHRGEPLNTRRAVPICDAGYAQQPRRWVRADGRLFRRLLFDCVMAPLLLCDPSWSVLIGQTQKIAGPRLFLYGGRFRQLQRGPLGPYYFAAF